MRRDEFVKRWSRALGARSASVFIGAGLSIAAGYPDWRTLLKEIADGLGLDISDEYDLAGVAQYCVNRSAGNRNKLKAAIIDNFPPKDDPPIPFKVLSRLPLRHVWTTNYDSLVETAWRIERKLIDVKSENKDLGHEMPWAHSILYKMHGTVDHPADVVIAKDDYELYRRVRPGFLQLLTGHLVSMEMLFLGFSFTDPNLSHLFSSIREAFPGSGPRHYAIVRRPQKGKGSRAPKKLKADQVRHQLWVEDLQRYGIECVEIDSFHEIDEILAEVEQQLARSSIFISGSYPVDGAANLSAERHFVEAVARGLGTEIAQRGKRLVSGYGLTVGSAAIAGVLDVILREETPNLDRSLMLRPFPLEPSSANMGADRKRRYREAMIRHAGVCIFIAGLSDENGKLGIGTGVIEEFRVAHRARRVCIPVAATGHAAAQIWHTMNQNWELFSLGMPRSLFDDLRGHKSASGVVKTVAAILDALDEDGQR